MTPFFSDQLHVVECLLRNVGRRSVEVVLLPVGPGALAEKALDVDAPILVLGDLGAYADRAVQIEWRNLARNLIRRGHRLAALLPAPSWRWPIGVEREWRAKTWDRSEGARASDVELDARAKRLLDLLSFVTVVEPGLLRHVRYLLPAFEADAGTEADAWQHSKLLGSNATGLSIEPTWAKEAREVWRQKRIGFERDVARNSKTPQNRDEILLRRRVIEVVRAWHGARGRELEHEEALTIRSVDPEGQPSERVDEAHDFVQKVVATPERALPTLGGWARRVASRLPDDLYQDAVLGPDLHRMLAKFPTNNGPVKSGYSPDGDRDRDPVVWQIEQLATGVTSQLVVAERDVRDRPGSLLVFVEATTDEYYVERLGGSTRSAELGSEASGLMPSMEELEETTPIPSWGIDAGVDPYGKWVDVEVSGVRFRLRWIEPGTFLMGSPEGESGRIREREQQREVVIPEGYWLADSTVTQKLWEAVMGENPSRFKGPRLPVERLGWHDAARFLTTVGRLVPGLDLRLPSESEWEYACRAGTSTPFSFGDSITTNEVNYDGDFPYRDGAKGEYRQTTVPVKSLPANPWGLHEMHGNVWEWCEDVFVGGPERVLRGGSWSSVARDCRSAGRHADVPSSRSHFVGFRVARGQGPEIESSPEDRSGARSPEGRGGGGAERRSKPALHIVTDQGRWRVDATSRPEWANGIGRDRFGLWATVEVEEVEIRLRWVPPGRFSYGSPSTEEGRDHYDVDQRTETVSRGFWIADTPCTQRLWQVVIGENPSYFASPDRPVERVSWDDTKKFFARINAKVPGLELRLPWEVEWEYACRAGTTPSTYAGELEIRGANDGPTLDRIAWYGGNSGVEFDLENGVDSSSWPERQYDHTKAGTRRVATKDPNRLGLYDTLGNVWEWCEDLFRDGPRRVLRGGSWSYDAWYCRSASRHANVPSYRSLSVGFRVARGQEPEPSSDQAEEPERGGGAPKVAEP